MSALDRIELGTAGYGPITLPARFKVVGYGQNEEQRSRYPSDNQKRIAHFSKLVEDSAASREARQAKSWSLIKHRTSLYYIFLLVLFAIGFFAVRFHGNPDAAARYKKVSRVLWLGETIGKKVPSVVGPYKKVLGWAQTGAEWAVPGKLLDPYVAEIFEKRPEFIGAILLAGIILFVWHKRLVAKIRHQGLGLWREAFAADREERMPGSPAERAPPAG